MSIYVKILEYNIRAPHFNGIIFYSDNPITQFLSCKAGVNILLSKKIINGEIEPSSIVNIDYDNEFKISCINKSIK